MDDGARFKALKSLACLRSAEKHYVFFVKGTPYSLFVWRGKVHWDNITTGESLTFEEAFDKLPDNIKEEIVFNLDLFR